MYLGQLERMWFLSVYVNLVRLSSKIKLVCLYFLVSTNVQTKYLYYVGS